MINAERTREQLITEFNGIHQRVAEIERLLVQDEHCEQLLSRLFLESPAAIYVALDGLFRFVSPQLRQITEYSESELLESSPLRLVLPEDSEMVRTHLSKLSSRGGSFVLEFRIVTKSAKVKWVLAAGAPISYESRQAVMVTLLDIDKHKLAEEEHRKRDETYRDLCENASDMIQCFKPDGRLLYVNSAWREALGYSEDETANLSLFEIIPSDYREHYLELLQQVTSGQSINGVEVVFISNDGKRIPVEGNLNCRFVDDKPVYIRGIFRDITERKRSQEKTEVLLKEVSDINRRLEQSNRELEDFAHVASHDLREPLRKISSFGTLLHDSLKDKLDEDERENLGFMIDGAKRMQSMIEDLLAYSRVTTKAKPFQQVDPNTVIENLKNFELATTLEETSGVVQVPQPLLWAYADPSQINQLFQNLIGNGLKFRRDGVQPIVTVASYRMPNNLVRFEVQDNGIGIEEAYHQQIFTMFKRLHSRAKYKGSGIGLAICKKIVQRHGGEIGLRSKAGEGSVFWFTLPAYGKA